MEKNSSSGKKGKSGKATVQTGRVTQAVDLNLEVQSMVKRGKQLSRAGSPKSVTRG